ncbi:hypothetical protein, partial [Escherichia coli]|uniref:hypothetical protein n=1 Tax=Escherichia coli TaxID=562 RepID=UPI001D0C82CF
MSENNENISVSHPVALLSCALLHIITGARSAGRGAQPPPTQHKHPPRPKKKKKKPATEEKTKEKQ